MLRRTPELLRKGKPRPTQRQLGPRFLRIPASHKPMQGGQPLFHQFLMQEANHDAAGALRADRAAAQSAALHASMGGSQHAVAADDGLPTFHAKLPFTSFLERRMSSVEAVAALNRQAEDEDVFQTRRAFNDLAYFEEQKRASAAQRGHGGPTADDVTGDDGSGGVGTTAGASTAAAASDSEGAEGLPDDVSSNDYFTATHGYSLIKDVAKTKLGAVDTLYSEHDMWAEQPKYHPGTYFMYCVARRRNVYAVIYNVLGKRMLNVYSAGNRGFKGTEKGFRSEGSAETAHQVTSQYLNDVIPKIREEEVAAGRAKAGETKKIELVVRMLGFYNGRQGSLRAITDRSDVFEVRHIEDITPFPANGPRMPRNKLKKVNKVSS